MGHQSFFETEKSPQTRMNTKKNVPDSKIRHIIWWRRVDSNHRSKKQQIYSLSPLATRELPHSVDIQFCCDWSWWTDLNPRPADYKSAALPTELHQLVNLFLVNRRVILYHIENRLSRVFLNFFDFFTLGFISFCCAVTTDNILSQSQTFVNPFSTIF